MILIDAFIRLGCSFGQIAKALDSAAFKALDYECEQMRDSVWRSCTLDMSHPECIAGKIHFDCPRLFRAHLFDCLQLKLPQFLLSKWL